MNNIIKENWEIIEQKLIKNMYEDAEFLLSLADEIKELLEKQINGGWIKCSDRLPEEPKPNPLIDGKPLELYLASVKNLNYTFRVFWNGKNFTDGFGKLEVLAWQPLPEPYQESEVL